MSRGIKPINWIIPTVRKHIIPQEALAGAGVAVGVDESAESWVIISALEIIEARLFIEVVASVPEWVRVAETAGGVQDVAPGIVTILRINIAARRNKLHNVALCVKNIVVRIVAGERFISVLPHGKGMPILVVEKVQAMHEFLAAVRIVSRFTHDLAVLGNIVIAPITQNTVYRNLYGLAAADTGHIISIVVSSDTTGQVLCNGAQSAALGPGEVCIVRTVVPVSRVAFAAAVIVVGQSEGRFSDRLHLSCLLDN